MSDRETETILLHRVEAARDLWAAIEIAQYGHVVTWDELEAGPPRDAAEEFEAAFGHLAEIWEETPDTSRDAVIARLDHHLGRLGAAGLSVFWGTAEGTVAGPSPTPLSVAVIYLSADDTPAIRIALSTQFSVG